MTTRSCLQSSRPAAVAVETAHERTPPDLAYTLFSLFLALILPGLNLFVAYAFARLCSAFDLKISEFIPLILTTPIPFCLGYIWARQAPLPETLFQRFAPMLAPLWLLFTVTGPIIWWMQREAHFLIQLLAALTTIYGLYILGFAWKSERRQISTLRVRGLAWLCVLFLLTGGSMGTGWYAVVSNTLYDQPPPQIVGREILTPHYQPFAESNLLSVSATPPTLRIATNHPRLDGAVALLPIYGAAAQAIYADLSVTEQKVVRCSGAPTAYQALLDGQIDIFFGMPPSPEQLESMKQQGLHPVIKPIAKEAFVFFVNKDNPVINLNPEQIRAVYTRRLTNWNQAGGADAPIVPFQRFEGSVSQTTMQQLVMRGQGMARPLRQEYQTDMGDIVNQVAAYRNWPNALGYSFRWDALKQFPAESIRFLSVDNVFPTPETIRDGTYPYIVPLVIVTCHPLSRESKELIDWITSPEGQALIANTGYVPLQ